MRFSVAFGEADVVHVADTFWNGAYPFIDYSTGGSIDGMIAASDANLAARTASTVVIAGHGRAVSNQAELRAFRDMLVAIRSNVAALKKQGRSREEAVAAKPTALSDRYHVIAPDYPGFGQSDMPDRATFAYTFDRFGELVNGLLDQLKVKRYAMYVMD